MLFAWRSRANCYFCYNQRLYEWCGLLEFYPKLFWNAESMEHKGSNGIYTWNSNRSLQYVYENKDKIKLKREDTIVETILKMSQGNLFINNEQDVNDIFNTTSCGLFCGK